MYNFPYRFVSQQADGEVFNLGSGYFISFYEMAQTVFSMVGNGSIRKVPWPENYEIIEGGDFVCDVSKAHFTELASTLWTSGRDRNNRHVL